MKKQKTFTIDMDIWEKFNEISKQKSINKSLLIENHLRDIIYLNENPKHFIIVGDEIKLLKYSLNENEIYILDVKPNIK